MEIARLNEKITFEKNEVVIDSIVNHKNTWIEYFTCHAYASTYQGDESNAAGTTKEEKTITFTVRYCSELSAVTSTRYRVRFRGESYDIQTIDPMNYQKRYLKIKCTKEKHT